MLKWCPYCQQFGGEVIPYDDFRITHEVCAKCEPTIESISAPELFRSRVLKSVQHRLSDAGRLGNLESAQEILNDCERINIRYLDVLLGFITPLLYQIGESWKSGTVTVADEHRFTRFCERVFDLISARVATPSVIDPSKPELSEILLINAPGNHHTLGLRILALWLANEGMAANILNRTVGPSELLALVSAAQPRVLLISTALADQTANVADFVEHVLALPCRSPPKIIVGGFAVKQGLVPAIPGAELIADINCLKDAIQLGAA